MKFTEWIKQLREEHQNAVATIFVRGDREGLIALWLADQVPVSVANNMEVADKAMGVMKKNMKE